MKKTFLFSLILLFLLSINVIAKDSSQIDISNANINAGDSFTLKAKLVSNTDGIIALRMETNIDLNYFEIMDISLENGYNDFSRLIGKLDNNQAGFFMYNSSSSTDDGELFSVRISSKANMPVGMYNLGLFIDNDNTLVDYKIPKCIAISGGNIVINSSKNNNLNVKNYGGGGNGSSNNHLVTTERLPLQDIPIVDGNYQSKNESNEKDTIRHDENYKISSPADIEVSKKITLVNEKFGIKHNKLFINANLINFENQEIKVTYDKTYLSLTKSIIKDKKIAFEFECAKGTPAGDYTVSLYANDESFAKFLFQYNGYHQTFFERLLVLFKSLFN